MGYRRMDACVPRPKKDGTWWHKVGTLWINDDDGKMNLVLDSYPLPNEKNEVRILFFEPREQGSKPAAKPAQSGRQSSLAEELDDEIPF